MVSTQALRWGILMMFCAAMVSGESRLINGTPVPAGTWQQVVRIQSNGAGCTATVVGPRVIITAAHCASDGATATFTVGTTKYDAKMYRSPLYQSKDHDVAIGVTSTEIAGIKPSSVGGKATSGLGITLLGYGCTEPGGAGGNDGILRMGDTVVTGFNQMDMVSKKAGGAALCFGDSGGPAFVQVRGQYVLLGINSKGNIQDTNYNTRLDLTESNDFLKTTATGQSLEICGINKDCGAPPPPPPGKPTCTLTATPTQIKLGESLTLSWVTQGQVDTATLDGQSIAVPSGSKSIQPAAAGTFTSRATVANSGGTNTCEATYNVTNGPPPPPEKPTCTLTAIPDTIQLGEQLTLEMSITGKADSAMIDGTVVGVPVGQKIVKPTAVGHFSASGTVTGSGGSSNCFANYEVRNEPPPPPDTPNFAVVGAYCGNNSVAESGVSRVCLAVIKHDATVPGLILNQVLLVVYRDATKEVIPIISRKTLTDRHQRLAQEELTLYANSAVPAKDYLVLDTRKATLTKQNVSGGDVPLSIQGRTAKGMFFLVENLTPNG